MAATAAGARTMLLSMFSDPEGGALDGALLDAVLQEKNGSLAGACVCLADMGYRCSSITFATWFNAEAAREAQAAAAAAAAPPTGPPSAAAAAAAARGPIFSPPAPLPPPPPPPPGAAAAAAKDEWPCPECTFSNPETFLACEVCGAPRAADAIPTQFLEEHSRVGEKRKREEAAAAADAPAAARPRRAESAGMRLTEGPYLAPPHWEDSAQIRVVPLDKESHAFCVLRLVMNADSRLFNNLSILPGGPTQFRSYDRESRDYTSATLRRAWRIENPGLWMGYQVAKQRVKDAIASGKLPRSTLEPRQELSEALGPHGDRDGEVFPPCIEAAGGLNELRLLHGTKPEHVLAIVEHGLNERMSGGIFGHGIYLADDVGKCDQYATRHRRGHYPALENFLYADREMPEDLYYVFVCRTVCGYPAITRDGVTTRDGHELFANKDKRELAMLPSGHHYTSLHFDSHRSTRHAEYVLFRGERVYPEYLLAYRREGGGADSARGGRSARHPKGR